jgi:hypothetical protein
MGSGTNRRWLRQFGSRSGRKAGSKSKQWLRVKPAGWVKAKRRRREARDRASNV